MSLTFQVFKERCRNHCKPVGTVSIIADSIIEIIKSELKISGKSYQRRTTRNGSLAVYNQFEFDFWMLVGCLVLRHVSTCSLT